MSSPVTIIIPNFNGKQHLAKHLPSVEQLCRDRDKLIIVDDASTDESVAWLQKRYNVSSESSTSELEATIFEGTFVHEHISVAVEIVQMKQNVRFAKAVNTAVKRVTTPTFLLLNNDVEPEAGILEILSQYFYNDQVFAVGCLEYEREDKSVIGGKNALWFERGIFQHARATEFSSGKTAWASGGSSMFSTDKWNELNGFDEKFYPAYWEDTDISMRARSRGWEVLFCAEAIVFHQHETSNASTFGKDEIARLSWKHQKYFTKKHAHLVQLVQYYFWQPYWWWKMKA